MHWFSDTSDVRAAEQTMSVKCKRLSTYPLFRVALDVVGHVPLVIGARRSNQTGYVAWQEEPKHYPSI